MPGIPVTAESVLNLLRTIEDPEMGINIVDLGLVYDLAVEDGLVRIKLTTTTRDCPFTEFIQETVEKVLWENLEGIEDLKVELVWEPRWSAEMMSPDARTFLGMK